MSARLTGRPMPYHRFRCSIGFREAREIVLAESRARYAEEGQCIRPTRSRILGKLRQVKLDEYAYYRSCALEGVR